MSGVIDKNGVQWERTSCCGAYVPIGDLEYEPPSAQNPYGRDLCPPGQGCRRTARKPARPSITVVFAGRLT